MRLHNRQIKAGFWTDADVVDWPLVKRLFYLGLIQLADDSGCLEHAPRLFKRQLFPIEDVSVEQLVEWTEEMLRQGKLTAYEAEGKACLYIRSFHKHQTLKTPARGDVPLPPWIEWQAYPSNPRAGRYVIHPQHGPGSEPMVGGPELSAPTMGSSDHTLTPVLRPSDDALTPAFDSAANRNRNQNHNRNQNRESPASPAAPTPPSGPVFSEDTVEYELAALLRRLILINNPHAKVPDGSPPGLVKWCKELDLLVRIDGRSPSEIRQVMEWCQADSFWRANILSPAKLRQKWDTLWLQMQRGSHASQGGLYEENRRRTEPADPYKRSDGTPRHISEFVRRRCPSQSTSQGEGR